jgi:hypothetical protein
MDRPQYKPWLVYPQLKVLETSLGTKTHRFFAEDLDSTPMELKEISFEFYAHELQRVDTSSEDSVKTFSEQYGLVLAPFYNSKQQFAYDRERKPGDAYPYPTIYKNSIEEIRQGLAQQCSRFSPELGNADSKAIDYLVDMFEGSLLARGAVANGDYAGQNIGGIVSVQEVAFTIRQLQVATTILSANSAGMGRNALILYMSRPKHWQHKHPKAFEINGKDVMLASWDGRNSKAWNLADEGRAKKLAQEVYGDNANAEQLDDLLLWLKLAQSERIEQALTRARSFTNRTHDLLLAENAGIRAISDYRDLADSHAGKIEDGSLLEAIIASLDYVLKSKVPWLRCKHCGKVFKYSKEYRPRTRYKTPVFCSGSCRVMDKSKPTPRPFTNADAN